MDILGPDGKPVHLDKEPIPLAPTFTVTRQLRRAYLRVCAIQVINQKAGGEARRLRRDMARQLAKRSAFIAEVREASHAW